jgi:hypothetical protein
MRRALILMVFAVAFPVARLVMRRRVAARGAPDSGPMPTGT